MQRSFSKKILHITPHFGGGVGRVLLNYLLKVKEDKHYIHKVVSLDYINKNASEIIKKNKLISFNKLFYKKHQLLKLISESDIVLIHWWNHPLLFDFLVREHLPPCRLIIWSHISGFHPPYVFTKKILKYPNLFVFTTPMSFKTKDIKNLSNKQKRSLRVIWSTGGVKDFLSVKPKKHFGFNIGYIGTVDYIKLHPNFLNICKKINIPDVKFIVCGGPSEKRIEKEAEKLGIKEKFEFTGPISNVKDYLAIFDIFGYPLSPYHYGTCDHVLQESMAAGVVPVVLSNPMERYMVRNGITGIVARDEKDYIKAIYKLYKDKSLREKLSQNARKYAQRTFSIEKMVKDWNDIFEEILIHPKTPRKWEISKKINEISAKDVFLESLGAYGKDFKLFCNAKNRKEKMKAAQRIKKLAKFPNWQANTKGTVHHYNSFFPRDKFLSFWSKLMKAN